MADIDVNGPPSTAELVSRAASQLSTLIRDELALARAELVAKGKSVGVGGGLFGAAGVLALYGVGLLVLLAVVALNIVWPLWLAVLAVAVVVFALAGAAVMVGRQKISSAMPLAPRQALDSARDDLQAVKDALQEGH